MKIKKMEYNELLTDFTVTTAKGTVLRFMLPTGAEIKHVTLKGQYAYVDVYSGWLLPMYARTVTYKVPRDKHIMFEGWPDGDWRNI